MAARAVLVEDGRDLFVEGDCPGLLRTRAAERSGGGERNNKAGKAGWAGQAGWNKHRFRPAYPAPTATRSINLRLGDWVTSHHGHHPIVRSSDPVSKIDLHSEVDETRRHDDRRREPRSAVR